MPHLCRTSPRSVGPVTEAGIGQVLDAPSGDEETPSIEEQNREWSAAVNREVTLPKQAGNVRHLDHGLSAFTPCNEGMRPLSGETVSPI
jgi:hypothetical protein